LWEQIERRIAGSKKEDELAQALADVTDVQVKAMLRGLADEMELYERRAQDFC
jgi:hypothetical protein